MDQVVIKELARAKRRLEQQKIALGETEAFLKVAVSKSWPIQDALNKQKRQALLVQTTAEQVRLMEAELTNPAQQDLAGPRGRR